MLPYMSESYAYMDAAVEKTCSNSTNGTKNVHKSDSVYVSYDDFSETITISTTAESKNVSVEIYKDGVLIYSDNDNVSNGSSLNYNITGEESGEYDLHVDIAEGGTMDETIVKGE